MEYTHKDFTDNRRGYTDADYSLVPRRKVWPTEQDAIDSMAGNEVAFRVYRSDNPNSPNPYSVAVLGEYIVIARESRSKPYHKTGESCLASCNADAIDSFGEDTALRKVISARDWCRIQSSQHLKAIGI